MATDVTDNNWNDKVPSSKGFALVQFTAPWCGPCRAFTPRLQELEDQGHFTYFKVDVDENTDLAREFQIMSVPTVHIYKDGRKVDEFVGVKPDKEVLDRVARA